MLEAVFCIISVCVMTCDKFIFASPAKVIGTLEASSAMECSAMSVKCKVVPISNIMQSGLLVEMVAVPHTIANG